MSISSFLRKIRKQKAVWWESTGADGMGSYSFNSPVEIDCRWDDIQTEYTDVNGDVRVSKARVISDRELYIDDFLKLGSVTGSTPSTPIDEDDAFKIRSFNKIPDLKNNTTVYIAYL